MAAAELSKAGRLRSLVAASCAFPAQTSSSSALWDPLSVPCQGTHGSVNVLGLVADAESEVIKITFTHFHNSFELNVNIR